MVRDAQEHVFEQERKLAVGPQGHGRWLPAPFHPVSESLHLIPSEASLD